MDKKLGNLEVIIEKSGKETVKKLGADLGVYLANAKEKNIPILFLSSGGSALSVLDFISSNVFGKYLTIGMLDERYDETNENNNFTQLTHTEFYKKAKDRGCEFIDTRVQNEQSAEMLANYFEEMLVGWREDNPKGEIIATVGVGIDGHTSGMMPHPENQELFKEFFEGDRWVVLYNATEKNPFPHRITTTITFLKIIKKIFVLMLGEKKAKIFLRMKENIPSAEMPAQVLKKLSGVVYVDEDVLKE